MPTNQPEQAPKDATGSALQSLQRCEGSRIVVPFHEVKDEGGMVQEGALRMVAVMERRAAATETGGWRWAACDGEGKAMALDVKVACSTCHVPKNDRSYVFSEWK